MAEGGFDDFEMKNINEDRQRSEEDRRIEERNEETSFNNEHNKSINIINTSNPNARE